MKTLIFLSMFIPQLAFAYSYTAESDFSFYTTIYTSTETKQGLKTDLGDSGFFNLSFDDQGQNVTVDALMFIDTTELRFFLDIPHVFPGPEGFAVNSSTGEFSLGPCCALDTVNSYLEVDSKMVDNFHLLAQDPSPILSAKLVNGDLLLNLAYFVGEAGDSIFEIGDSGSAKLRYVANPEPATWGLLLLGLYYMGVIYKAKTNENGI